MTYSRFPCFDVEHDVILRVVWLKHIPKIHLLEEHLQFFVSIFLFTKFQRRQQSCFP